MDPQPSARAAPLRPAPAGEDPLPPELEGEVETELLELTLFKEVAVVLPRYRALLLSDTGRLGLFTALLAGGAFFFNSPLI